MAFDAGQVEDGSGLSTAIAYEEVAVTAAWLVRRGKTAFNAKTEAEQEGIALNATSRLDSEFQPLFRGVPVNYDQGLVWPARGAFGADGRPFDSNGVPPQYLEAMRLLCEELASADTVPSQFSALGRLKSARTSSLAVTWQDGHSFGSIKSTYPTVWRLARRALPGSV